jgi:hypothetical protein
MVLSDLAVHREQTGAAAECFDPHVPESIARSLERLWNEHPAQPTLAEQQAAAANAEVRIREFAAQFVSACDQAREYLRSDAA